MRKLPADVGAEPEWKLKMQGKLALKILQHGTECIKSRAPLSLKNASETGDHFASNYYSLY
jgi:hypothetical protein